MLIYICALMIAMFFAAQAQKVRKISQLKTTYMGFCILSFLPLTLVSMLRYEVGTDWIIYDDYFHWINEGRDKFSEPGFNLLNRILYCVTHNSWILFAVVAFLILLFTFLAFYQQSIWVPFTILIFFISGDYFNSQNQIRQVLAMSIFLFAMKYIWSRDWKRYFLWLLIAFSFHVSALIFIPLYFLYGIKLNVKKLIILYLATILLLPIFKKILVFVVSKTKYSWYFDSVYNTNDFYMLGFIYAIFFCALFFYYHEVGKETDLKYDFMVVIYYLSALSVLFSSAIPQMVRVTTGLSCISGLCIPRMIVREEDKKRRVALIMLVVSAFLVKLLYDIYHNGWYDAMPYQTIFSIGR